MLSPENGRKTENVKHTDRFELGRVVATPAALDALERAGVLPQRLLWRHAMGDWGDISDDDKVRNERALIEGERILSAYDLPVTGERVWIITEWDRSYTTVLLPDDY